MKNIRNNILILVIMKKYKSNIKSDGLLMNAFYLSKQLFV
jgi:hypothetical protein